jgi:thymidylate kinase
MLIFLEGTDKSGKSTFARKWADQTGYALITFSYQKELEDYGTQMGDFGLGYYTSLLLVYYALRRDMIITRSPLTEYAYAFLFDRPDPFEKVKWWVHQLPKDHLFIFLDIPHSVYLHRAQESKIPDTRSLADPFVFDQTQWNYFQIIDRMTIEGLNSLFIEGTLSFKEQYDKICDYIMNGENYEKTRRQ